MKKIVCIDHRGFSIEHLDVGENRATVNYQKKLKFGDESGCAK